METFVDIVTYLANGFLAVVYLLFDGAPHLLSAVCGAFIMFTFDRWAQQQAVFAPGRYERSKAARADQPRTAQITTAVVLGLWLGAAWSFGPPVPLIGAAMWLTAVLALLMMPQQRWSLLWTTKAGLALYSLTVIGYRLYLWQAARLSPAQLADVFGGAVTASEIIARNTGTFATVGAWLLWAVMPAGYVGVLIQNWAAQPMGIVNPLAGARDVLAAIRTRGNRSLPDDD